jgi:hypothetical protein
MVFRNLPPSCPPDDAESCFGVVFRLAPSLPIDQGAFQSYFSLRPGTNWGEKECMAHGLSVFRSYEATKRLRKRIKSLSSHKIIFTSLKDEVGVIKQTESPEHHTWWPDDDFDLPSLFVLYPDETQ